MDMFNYIDYRKYLKDALVERKEQNYHFSYRFIAQHLNLSSPGFFNWIVSGKRKLPEAFIPKLAILFKFTAKECAYFSLLVRHNHSTDPTEREELLQKLSQFAKREHRKEINPEQYHYFSKWYYIAIRELLHIYDFKDDYRSLALQLQPKIKSVEAREAIETLEKIGLIAPDENGFYRPVDKVVTTGETWKSEMITNLQMILIDLGKKAILSVPKTERDISNLTVCITDNGRQRISQEIAMLRKKILEISENDRGADNLYQCNIQLFPLAQKK
jgi:uncharacterized protein (TIGR02147 family)